METGDHRTLASHCFQREAPKNNCQLLKKRAMNEIIQYLNQSIVTTLALPTWDSLAKNTIKNPIMEMSEHGVRKSLKKSYSTLRANRATFTFWVDKS